MNIESCFEYGRIIKPHGVKGEVLVTVTADNKEDLKKNTSVFLDIDSKLIPFIVEKINVTQNKAIIKFEDVNSEQETEMLLKQKIFLPLIDLPSLKKGQFYYHEIVNYLIEDIERGKLGLVKAIFEMPGQDLIAMEYRNTEVLIPIENSIVLEADHVHKILKVNLPDGLLELYTDSNTTDKDED